MREWQITTFYSFVDIDDPEALAEEFRRLASQLELRGLIILAKEGINSTMSAPTPAAMTEFKGFVVQRLGGAPITFKDSTAFAEKVFAQFKIKIRPEIVTIGHPEIRPRGPHHHLSPKEWQRVLKEENDIVLLDTRNNFEVEMGTFRKAINPQIRSFSDFADRAELDLKIPKDKKVLIFCTGGIRCEKAQLELERRGYKDVYQLEGGILNYLNEFPDEEFLGECFVFDERVAVDQHLKPSQRFKLCPHCGVPGERTITCPRCDGPGVICEHCFALGGAQVTCSKECAHHFRLRPGQKRRLPPRRPRSQP